MEELQRKKLNSARALLAVDFRNGFFWHPQLGVYHTPPSPGVLGLGPFLASSRRPLDVPTMHPGAPRFKPRVAARVKTALTLEQKIEKEKQMFASIHKFVRENTDIFVWTPNAGFGSEKKRTQNVRRIQ